MAQTSHHLDHSGSLDRRFARRQAWPDVWQLVLLLVAFGAGLFIRQAPAYSALSQGWTMALLALGTLCLGFGAGMLVYRRRQHSETAALRKEFADLSDRARFLGEETDKLIERERRPRA